MFRLLSSSSCLLCVALAASGCSSSLDGSSPLSKQAAIDAANIALSQGDCSTAISTLSPVYNSQYSDNDVRMIMASAYACDTGLNLFDLVNEITNNASLLGSGDFWSLLAQLFPSASSDAQAGGILAQGALLSVLNPGAAILPANLIAPTGYNPGSVNAPDRTVDSNSYLIFAAMAAIGVEENASGVADPSNAVQPYRKKALLPGTTAISLNSAGCAYASSIVNFVDALGAAANNLNGPLQSNLQTLYTTFSAVIFNACEVGCAGSVPVDPINNPNSTWVGSGCSFSASACASCPLGLRNSASCTFQTSDQASCAASGIVNFMNSSTFGWLGPPGPNPATP